jgi:hypothetical protein
MHNFATNMETQTDSARIDTFSSSDEPVNLKQFLFVIVFYADSIVLDTNFEHVSIFAARLQLSNQSLIVLICE